MASGDDVDELCRVRHHELVDTVHLLATQGPTEARRSWFYFLLRHERTLNIVGVWRIKDPQRNVLYLGFILSPIFYTYSGLPQKKHQIIETT